MLIILVRLGSAASAIDLPGGVGFIGGPEQGNPTQLLKGTWADREPREPWVKAQVCVRIVKKDGHKEAIYFDKISSMIVAHCTKGLHRCLQGSHHASQLDELVAGPSTTMTINHPDYVIISISVLSS
ncbi:hypothetical protein QJS10_CPB11g01987 [Acorus calamus]|uniref:Uncharacterized protein n=1 Tax=Acorus calamus TaxID=4465 RepID=A0AAV9DRM5_ACOCL|nr:hypothetical protein QJS10_CPB11g01987 [Acorus calamus]